MKGPNIAIRNFHKTYTINEAFIKNIVIEILKLIKKPQETRVEVIFLNDDSMRSFNRIYKKRDCYTDVLSFKIDLTEFKSKGFLGEILISIDRAYVNAKNFKTEPEKELALYIIHGILHLFGYEDEKERDRLRMSKKESEVLNRLCERGDLSKALTPR